MRNKHTFIIGNQIDNWLFPVSQFPGKSAAIRSSLCPADGAWLLPLLERRVANFLKRLISGTVKSRASGDDPR
jgi:hypothetical protein